MKDFHTAAVTIREDRMEAIAPTMPEGLPVFAVSRGMQTEEVCYWRELYYCEEFLAGRLQVPICLHCGLQGQPCAWGEPCPGPPQPIPDRGALDEDEETG